MILRFKAEDLVSIILENTEDRLGAIPIEYRRINIFREKLRVKGTIIDLGQRELETIQVNYPENIIIEQRTIVVNKTEQFVSRFARRADDFCSADRNEVLRIWKEIE